MPRVKIPVIKDPAQVYNKGNCVIISLKGSGWKMEIWLKGYDCKLESSAYMNRFSLYSEVRLHAFKIARCINATVYELED